ncbi:hypothetical protein EV561_101776 [Rhizobium sp. BK376]|nr:hypothetical protein EV561_101776 [Rhizobium sp. BK376]
MLKEMLRSMFDKKSDRLKKAGSEDLLQPSPSASSGVNRSGVRDWELDGSLSGMARNLEMKDVMCKGGGENPFSEGLIASGKLPDDLLQCRPACLHPLRHEIGDAEQQPGGGLLTCIPRGKGTGRKPEG